MTELRYKEGIPIFDGSAEQYVAYRRAALNYVETLEWKKRPLAGPRLQAVLEGAAKAAVQHKPPGWISHDRGAQELLDYLKGQVQPPTLAEAGKTISRFFYQVKRRKGETMNAWIVRHDEALYEARRTLAEAIQEYGKGYSGSTRTATRSEREDTAIKINNLSAATRLLRSPGPSMRMAGFATAMTMRRQPNMTVRTGGPKVHGGAIDLAGETMIEGKTMDGGLPLPRRT